MNQLHRCEGSIAQLFISEQKRDYSIGLVNYFLKSFGSKDRHNNAKKFCFLNRGRFDHHLPANVVIYGFIVPLSYADYDAKACALLARAVTNLCAFYEFAVYFEETQYRSEYYRCLDNEQWEGLTVLSKLPLGD